MVGYLILFGVVATVLFFGFLALDDAGKVSWKESTYMVIAGVLALGLIIGAKSLTFYSVSDGVRNGQLVKASLKGIVIKTCEAELMLSEMNRFRFSAPTDKCDALMSMTGKEVSLSYDEFLLNGWNDTKHFMSAYKLKGGK